MQGIALLGGLPTGLGAMSQGYVGVGLVTLLLSAGLFYLGSQAEQDVEEARDDRQSMQSAPSAGPANVLPPPTVESRVDAEVNRIENAWMVDELSDSERNDAYRALGHTFDAVRGGTPVIRAAELLDDGCDVGGFFDALSFQGEYEALWDAAHGDEPVRLAFIAAFNAEVEIAAAGNQSRSLIEVIDDVNRLMQAKGLI